MYHRHPKRRNHQRQALSVSQLRDERPPLPPKGTPPVPPPRRHKISGDRMSASPKPPMVDQRRATLGHLSINHNQTSTLPLNTNNQHSQQIPPHLQSKLSQPSSSHLGSMPYLGGTQTIHAQAPVNQTQSNTVDHISTAWGRPRGSLPGFHMPSNMPLQAETWENTETHHPPAQNWGRPLRRGASVLELGGNAAQCAGCAHCAPTPWRYGSCASLEHGWMGGWPPPPPNCCVVHPLHILIHPYPPQTPQPYRRAESRTSRAVSRTGSRAASPAASVRSRTSRRMKHRTPSPPPLPSSDADSESESDAAPAPTRMPAPASKRAPATAPARAAAPAAPVRSITPPQAPINQPQEEEEEESLGPAPPPPDSSWQCEHCTFVNEPGVRVCVICCRTPTAAPKIIDDVSSSMSRLKVQEKSSPSPVRATEDPRVKLNGEETKNTNKKDRISTGCGTSPPREEKTLKKPINRLMTPTRENSNDRTEHTSNKIDTGTGMSNTWEPQSTHKNTGTTTTREISAVRASPYRESISTQPGPQKHSVSVGPSPPRENVSMRVSVDSSSNNSKIINNKKSTGTSPPRGAIVDSRSSPSSHRANVSNTGTSPPPQSISTQTYEVPNSWERAPSVSRSRSRPRRRFRDDARRERSHSRHSLSSDTRESERSARTSGGGGGGGGGGRWEWRETRDSSPGGEWSDGERRRPATRLTRRASHLDLHRTRPVRRSSFYGSEAASPEPLSSTRAISLEALVSAGARREAERGLELARLMSEAERLGFSAAEVHAALAQSPTAPLAWLRERWPSLCAGVRAAAARLAPRAAVTELEARAALARHRGAMWPAVTDCVERHRRQTEPVAVGEERRLRGHVWGSPAGADDDAAPPVSRHQHQRRPRAEDSSDEFEVPGPTVFRDDDWMYLPLDTNINQCDNEDNLEIWDKSFNETTNDQSEDIASQLKSLLMQAGVPSINENLLLKGLLADNVIYNQNRNGSLTVNKPYAVDLSQPENDFINAYNALTRLSPLPNINEAIKSSRIVTEIKENDITQNAYEMDIDKGISTIKYNQQEPIEENIIQSVSSNIMQVTDNMEQASKQILNETSVSPEKTLIDALDEVKQILENNSNPERHDIEIKENTNVSSIKNTENAKSAIEKSFQAQTTMSKDSVIENINNVPENLTVSNEIIEQPQNLIIIEQNIASTLNRIEIQDHPETPAVEYSITNVNAESIPDESTSLTERKKGIIININQEQDKPKNLNDIVDNTQKLIQQMKEEINSDIYSIEDGNVSHSEIDTSSNESDFSSEHESSYSETEGETDNLTSDENVESSIDEEEQITEKHTSTLNRTSSEDNEQFEEAMDHIQEQIEDFKHANIEILDSIARSLQEEQIISAKLHYQKPPDMKRQDQNNNVFTTVNSFEEIYEQLSNNDIVNSINSENKEMIKSDTVEMKINNLEKQEINISLFKPVAATKLVLVEQKTSMYNAIKENIKEPLILNNINEINSNYNNNKVDNDNNLDVTSIPQASESIDNNNTNDNIQNNSRSKSTSPDNKSIITKNITNTINIEENRDVVSLATNNIISESVNTSVELVEKDNKSRNNTPEKTSDDRQKDNSATKHIAMSKSNIPKLIRVVQKNKNKEEKLPSKTILSKVPVRRSSLKQYPAPAPPKTHFGAIQSGFVKQLQTKLFNDKSPQIDTNNARAEGKAISTSTLNKKKQAPSPPSRSIDNKQPSPQKVSPPREKKKNYFRETCRTEDEWTESESEDSQLQIAKPSDEPLRAPSPPPPITVRRVSGQIIDLARIRLPEGSPERQARMLLAEGAAENWEQAHLAVDLVSRGVDPPDALLAALECIDLTSALAYLNQDCELCASRLPEHEMVTMLRCTHRCCRECASLYFNVQITERSIADCVCPFCKVPELENLPEDAWLEYFAHLDILLKTLLEPDIHELFQRKLRDRTLARDPNFRWCMECSSGFFVHPKQKKLRCPECKSVSCANCRKSWSSNHEGLTCDQYAKWLEDNDPELSMSAVQQHLRENGLECPRCHFKYSLSRGGCMHFTCTQCKYEFCYGCGKPFMMGAQCGLSEYCAKLGLHSHHPRNCLFYLRDKEPHELQTLLQMNNVTYETEAPEGSTNRCPIQLQRETPTGLVDGTCGNDVPPQHGGLCKNHYLEYLSRIAHARGVDPLPLLGVDDLETLVRRAALRLPPRPYGSLEGLYKRALLEIVREKIPLD
ncbi:LOW QUALITY PROTEIN: uncharacterized protein ACR2FA_001070 [Aphomia sociella]